MCHPRVGHACIVGRYRRQRVRQPRPTARWHGIGLIAAAAVLLLVAGCTANEPRPAPGSPATSTSATSTSATSIPATSSATASPSTSASAPLPIRYLVAPHPDDEFAIWSMAQDSAHFPV